MRIKNKLFVFMVLMSICLFPVFAQGVTDTQNLVADVESVRAGLIFTTRGQENSYHHIAA